MSSIVFNPSGQPASPSEGEVYYDSTADKLKVRDASSFKDLANDNQFVGMIAPFAMSTPPTGWLACDGSAISRSTYASLFTAIGTTWGAGDGSSTFALPDLEGAFLRGTGSHGTSNMADGNDFAGPSVGSFENDMVEDHKHFYRFSDGNRVTTAPTGGTGYHVGTYNTSTVYQGAYTDDAVYSGRGGAETRPFNAGVKYCIKY